jgi:hypothetical protein
MCNSHQATGKDRGKLSALRSMTVLLTFIRQDTSRS